MLNLEGVVCSVHELIISSLTPQVLALLTFGTLLFSYRMGSEEFIGGTVKVRVFV